MEIADYPILEFDPDPLGIIDPTDGNIDALDPDGRTGVQQVLSEHDDVAVEIANGIIAHVPWTIADRLDDLDAVRAMELVQLVDVPDIEEEAAAVRIGRPQIEKHLRAIQVHAGKRRRQHAGRRAARTVQHQHGLAGRLADGGVVQPQLRHGLAGMETEILCDPVALFRRGIVGGEYRGRDERECNRRGRSEKLHGGLP